MILRFALAAALALAGCGFSERDVQCQRAGAHLVECCPGLAVNRLSCNQFSELTSECILAASCEALVDNGFCDASQFDSVRMSFCQ